MTRLQPEVSKFELQSHYYIPFLTNTLRKDIEPPYPTPLAMGSVVPFRVFANGPGDLGSIPSQVISKTQKMVLDLSLLNTQHYKVRIKGKVEQSRERSTALPYTLV